MEVITLKAQALRLNALMMLQRFYLAACLFFMMIFPLQGQNLNDVCVGTRVRYGIDGTSKSTFTWTVEGGNIVSQDAKGDSVDVLWGDVPGTYTLAMVQTTALGCVAQPVTAKVNVKNGFSIDLGKEINLCKGQTWEFNPGVENATYQWQDGSTAPTYTTGTAGKYWVDITDARDCKANDTASVVVHDLPALAIKSSDAIIENNVLYLCKPPVTIEATTDNINSAYLWSSGETSPDIALSLAPQTVWVKVTDPYNCVSSDTLAVAACPSSSILEIPNAFTPNGDGQNDTWQIRYIELFPEVTVDIYDSWGAEVFKSDRGYPQPWDGTFGGKPLPMNSYYYVINLHDGEKAITGNVAIIR